MTKISVIVPVYNVEKYLAACLDSIIAQTLTDIEIICVNDGSTDHSSEILRQYAEKDARICIIEQDNSGTGAARNNGIRAARGKYIFFCDSDDCMVSDGLELIVERMERYELECLYFNAEAFGEDAETAFLANNKYKFFSLRQMDENCLFSGPELFTKLKQSGAYITTVWTTAILRTVVLEKSLWFIPGILHEDEPWTFSVLMKVSRAGCMNQILYRYRIRKNSIINSELSFQNTYGCFVALIDSLNHVEKSVCSAVPSLTEMVIANTLRLQKHAITRFRSISEGEKLRRSILDPRERILFESAVVYPASLLDIQAKELASAKNEKEKLKKEIEKLAIEIDNQKHKVEDLSCINTNLKHDHEDLDRLIQHLKLENESLERSVQTLKHKNDDLNRKRVNLDYKIKKIEQSYSFRLGRMITWFPRKIRSLFKP